MYVGSVYIEGLLDKKKAVMFCITIILYSISASNDGSVASVPSAYIPV